MRLKRSFKGDERLQISKRKVNFFEVLDGDIHNCRDLGKSLDNLNFHLKRISQHSTENPK